MERKDQELLINKIRTQYMEQEVIQFIKRD